MSTPLQELIDDLKISYGQPVDDATARRSTMQSITFVNSDLGTNYQVSGSQPNEIVDPDLVGVDRELVLLRAQAYLTRINRTANASSVTFKSADKSVSRSATGWQNLERDLLAEYWRIIASINPDKAEGVLVVNDNTEIYKQGWEVEQLVEPITTFGKDLK